MRTFSLIVVYLLLMIFLISVHSYANGLTFEINRIDKYRYTGRLINDTDNFYEHILVDVDFYYYSEIKKVTKKISTFEFHNVYPHNTFVTKVKKDKRNKWRHYSYTIYEIKHIKERK
jgi:hypothetical protein